MLEKHEEEARRRNMHTKQKKHAVDAVIACLQASVLGLNHVKMHTNACQQGHDKAFDPGEDAEFADAHSKECLARLLRQCLVVQSVTR